MAHETIIFQKEDSLATIILNRPDRLNALNETMGGELLDAVQACKSDPAIRALLLTGAGRAFCSGGDQKRETTAAASGVDFTLVDLVGKLVLALRDLPKPVVAALNGPAMGAGLNIALACDFRYAAENARLGATFVKIGLSPDSGGSYWLPRLVGLAKATEIIMCGDIFDAGEAERLGLVNKVLPGDHVVAAAREFALRLANGPTLALGRAKMLLNRSQQNSLSSQLDFERELIGESYRTQDYREGKAAFQEKRPPEFRGV